MKLQGLKVGQRVSGEGILPVDFVVIAVQENVIYVVIPWLELIDQVVLLSICHCPPQCYCTS